MKMRTHQRRTYRQAVLTLGACLGVAGAASLGASSGPCEHADSCRPGVLRRLAFGSCSQQWRPQDMWHSIGLWEPDLWLWTGDAVYSKTPWYAGGELGGKVAADLTTQRALLNYSGFLSKDPGLVVEGVYDDHDFGWNDAGAEHSGKNASQQAFLDFLGVPAASPRRARAGLYSSHLFGPPGERVKVVLMDTRYHRARHWLPSCAGVPLPLSAVAAALSRWLVARVLAPMLGGDWAGARACRSFDGDMLVRNSRRRRRRRSFSPQRFNARQQPLTCNRRALPTPSVTNARRARSSGSGWSSSCCSRPRRRTCWSPRCRCSLPTRTWSPGGISRPARRGCAGCCGGRRRRGCCL